jgi:hypothetical protein
MRKILIGVLASLAAAVALPLTATAQKPPKEPNKVTLSASANPIIAGKATTLSGKVTGPDRAGAAVELVADPFPVDTGQVVATATSDANGDFTFPAQKPDRHTRYVVRAKTSPPATSENVDVHVRIRLTLTVADLTPERGERVLFSGTATPEHDGRRVRIQRRTATGTWRTVARATLADAGAAPSTYSRLVTIRRDGTYRAHISGDADHLKGKSRRRALDVH